MKNTIYQYIFPEISVPEGVLRAQFAVIKNQLPTIYLCVLANIAMVVIAYWGSAPLFLVAIIPAIFSLIIVRRLFYWKSRTKNEDMSAIDISKEFSKSTILAWAYTILVGCWSVAILPYGNMLQIVLMVCFLWTCAATMAVGLAYLPRAQIGFIVLSAGPFCYGVILSGEPLFWILPGLFSTFYLIFLRLLKQHYQSFLKGEIRKIELKEQIEQTEAVQKQMEHLALTDPLTGLPNRRAIFNTLKKQFETRQDGNRFAAGIIDLDGFKPVNDVYGHACGDAVLIEVGKRVTEVLGDRGLASRVGGDEFGLIITDMKNDQDVMDLGFKIAEALRQPYDLGSSTAMLSSSLGFAICPDSGDNPEVLLDNADKALYRAKKSNSHDVEIYDPVNHRETKENSAIEQALRQAIATDSIELNYLPIVELSSGRVVAFEALARWFDPTHGEVAPDKFIAVAEQTGLIIELTDLLFNKAVKNLASWPSEIGLSFNISAVYLANPRLGLSIISTLSKYQLLPSRLQIEITESALMSNFTVARKTICDLSDANIQVALDNFGIGFGSFDYLDQISVDKLKIDGRFVPSTGMANGKRQIQKAIVGLSSGLGIPVIQEGIENADQHQEAINAGCHYGQGHLYSVPMLAGEIANFLGEDADNADYKIAHTGGSN